ncbi:NupC/NupG family nucleoside CNT transporter [Truepera radiovictrix]|uniref:Nucleoside permease n=1 Tax=Truepera radiovictrix (strain DSM 17093 / CIP 108686 / LMG 22925 / RQ-24) TaxID=649638 RepID=D7CU17_TRURR|nr:nucleoside transporter [Truepera radiovictrix DSM 17093]
MALIGVVGMGVLLGLGWLLSLHRTRVRWRPVLGALAIQFAFGFVVLRWPPGRQALQALAFGVQSVIDYAAAGIDFLFGGLTAPGAPVSEALGTVFAFQVLPVIVFFASLLAVLYHLGVMPWVVRILGGGLSRLLGTSRAESLSASANIFVGQTEAPLTVRPYIPTMTQSELFAVMVGGLASVAGSVLAGYAQLGVPLEYLIAASFMAAPAGLLMAKLVLPETEAPQEAAAGAEQRGGVRVVKAPAEEVRAANVIDAAARGASEGLGLALNVGAMLLAFIGLIALANGLLGGVGGLLGVPQLSLELLLGYLFAPLAFVIGVPWADAPLAGSLIGQKLVLNEFVAFVAFQDVLGEGAALGARTEAIITFALTGFANFGSLAILLGGLGGLAPSRRGDIARLGLRAVAAATLANLMSAAIAGLLL